MIARSLRAQRTHFLEHVGIWHLDLLVGLSMLEIFTIEFVDRIDDAQFLPKKGNYSKINDTVDTPTFTMEFADRIDDYQF